MARRSPIRDGLFDCLPLKKTSSARRWPCAVTGGRQSENRAPLPVDDRHPWSTPDGCRRTEGALNSAAYRVSAGGSVRVMCAWQRDKSTPPRLRFWAVKLLLLSKLATIWREGSAQRRVAKDAEAQQSLHLPHQEEMSDVFTSTTSGNRGAGAE